MFRTCIYPVVNLGRHVDEPWVLIMNRGLTPVQIKSTSHFQLEQTHLKEMNCDTLGKNWFCSRGDSASCDVPIVDQLEEFHVNIVMGDAEGAGATQSMGKPKLH